MGKVLSVLFGSPPGNVLDLPWRPVMPPDIRREIDRALAAEYGREQCGLARQRAMHRVGTYSLMATGDINEQAEVQASRVPQERARVDMMANAIVMGFAGTVIGLGQ